MSEIDWGSLQKEAATAGVMPDGDYNVMVYEATATKSSNGKPMIKVKARVIDGPKKDKPVYTQFVVSAENGIALRIFFQHMAAFGLDSNFFGQNPPMDVVAKNLMNRGATFTLGTREWQGADRNEVNGVKALPSGGPIVPGLVVTPPVVGGPAGSPMATLTAATPSPTSTPATPTVGASPQVGVTPGAPPATPF